MEFFDRGLKLLGTVNLTPASSPNAEMSPYYGMEYISDGSRVFIPVSDGSRSPLAVLDTQQFKETGLLLTYYRDPGSAPYLLATDGGQSFYLAAVGGIGREDCCTLNSSAPYYQISSLVAQSAALNTPTTVTFSGSYNLPSGTTFSFGGVSATLQSTHVYGQPVVSVPPSAVTGPVDVVITMPDSTTLVYPQGFAFGTTILNMSSNFAAAQASTVLAINGFGLVSQNLVPSVRFGSSPAVSTSIAGYGPAPNALNTIQSSAPASPAGTVDVTVSNGNGASTLKGALTYTNTTIIPATPGCSLYLIPLATSYTQRM